MSSDEALLLARLASLAAGSVAHSQAPSKAGQKATTKSAPAKQSPRPSPLERLQQDAYEALDRNFQARQRIRILRAELKK